MQKKLFSELNLSPETMKAVTRMGFEQASPIQTAAIPVILGGSDVVGQSQTGSGKTAAFAIPILERIDAETRAPQALILCPTRELAMQVADEVSKLAFYRPRVRELPIYGGQSYERQFRGLQAGAQIIIGTPGRVIDHLDRGTLNLGQMKTIVLDECDRMLDMGFREDIERILESASPERQTVFFSATMPKPIQQMIQRFAKNPEFVKIEAATVDAPTIEQAYYEVAHRSKLEVLCRLIDHQDIKYGIIFCGTKMMVDELTEQLTARGYAADKLHGDMSQAMRERTMRRFREKKVEFLVATDVAARGIDVNDVEVVFNYDLPQDPEDYVHRIGRTGRAGRAGRAITFVGGREIYKLQQILRYTKGRIRRETIPTLNELEEKRTSSFFQTLRETLEAGEYKRQDECIDQLLDQGYASTDIASALIHLLMSESTRAGAPIPEDTAKPGGGGGYRESGPRAYPKYVSRGQAPREAAPEDGGPAGEQKPAGKGKRKPDADFAWQDELERPRPQKTAEQPYAPRERREEDERARPVSHEAGMTRLALNQGRDHGIAPGDVVGVIAGVAKIPRESIGAIKLLPKQTLVDVAEDSANVVLEKLSGIRFKGRKLAIAPATDVPAGGPRRDKREGRDKDRYQSKRRRDA